MLDATGWRADKPPDTATPDRIQPDTVQVFDTAGQYVGVEDASGKVQPAQEKPDPLADLTEEQRFIATLKDMGRVRLAARAEVGGRIRGWVEWVNTSGETVEQLEVSAIEALGFTATWAEYGVKLTAGKHVIVATPWPRVMPVRTPTSVYTT
ncbi:hypothetical protein [Pseudoxanthomonas japonensis]|uniref:hypothetical protein n=1 Tax=Pseudoxanthomonas japonensis TaxID=69284 RepID=UPI0037483E26